MNTSLIHHVLLYIENFTEDNFIDAMTGSTMGGQWYWSKFLEYKNIDATTAMLRVLLSMDNEHFSHMCTWIRDVHYKDAIRRRNRDISHAKYLESQARKNLL